MNGICLVLGSLLKVFHKEQIELGGQMFDTLIELIQGPNKSNIEILLSFRITE